MKNKILEQSKMNLDLEGYVPPYEKAYLIAMTPRSGSTLLCDLLSNTGLAGKPNEFLNPDYITQRLPQYSDKNSLAEVFSKSIDYTMGKNKTFGIKASYYQAEPFIESNLFDKLLPNIKIINLFRRNILKQAISLLIAAETKFFHTGDNQSNRDQKLKELDFNKTKIFTRVKEIYDEEEGWIRFLDKRAYSYMKLFYEDNINDIDGTVKTILMYIGVKEEEEFQNLVVESKYTKVSTGINDKFYQLYLNDDEMVKKTLDLGITMGRLIE